MTYAFLTSLIAGGITSAIFAALWKGAQHVALDERKARVKAESDLSLADTALKMVEAARADEKARLEAVIATKKQEIAALESDNYACNSPAILRERLRSLLRDLSPDQTTGVGSSPNVSVPYGGAPKP